MLDGEQLSYIVSQACRHYQFSKAIRQRAWVEIDHQALADNIRALKGILAPQTALMAVVKADAYGHGAIKVAETVLRAGATWLAIATLGEGVELREAGITAPILVLGATNTTEEIEAIAHWDLQPTLCTLAQVKLFDQTAAKLGKILPVHLKIDTGMSRLGTRWEEALPFVSAAHAASNLNIASIYSHFATADEPDPSTLNQQHQRFQEAIANFQQHGIPIPKLHISNSAATLHSTALHYDLVRIGLSIYGVYPAPHLAAQVSLRPVLQVKARITQIKTLPPNTGVSYGHRFKTSAPTKIAVVGIGYADGVPRRLSNQLKVLVNGIFAPQVGAITMDQIMLDVTHLPAVQVGDVVTLIGHETKEQLTVDQWANQLGTISWEILCGFKHRLPRINL
ncbi:alanine racemase [[Synechococcus] sp. NIES-970]|uniref:alanine racemase n=1 Tax=Picosynechococcus sp. NKBG15041c TaxID=1407650 RepID=UPI00046700C5|nr:alanine racemase [Picosynechococcus sp. NKBG15041c]BAW97122.1 alanine racemase [[Synechococcus] sp. NIES-970]